MVKQYTDHLIEAQRKAREEADKILGRMDSRSLAENFINTDVRYVTPEQQNIFQRARMEKMYYPYEEPNRLFTNAAEAGVGAAAGLYTARQMYRRTGNLGSGLAFGGAVGTLAGGIAMAGIEEGFNTTDSISAIRAKQKMEQYAPIDAYFNRANWMTSRMEMYGPEAAEYELQQPIERTSGTLNMDPSSFGAGASDLVSMGIVQPVGAQSGRNAAQVIKEAGVVFKALSSFFGSVDMTKLRGQIKEMMNSGFTPETMAIAGQNLQQSIFSSAPPGLRNQVIQQSMSAGAAYSDRGLSPTLGSSLYTSARASGYRDFGNLDEFSQFRFRTPEKYTQELMGGVTRFVSNTGIERILGSGDIFQGMQRVSEDIDLSSIEGQRKYKELQYEYSKNLSSGDIFRSIENEAQQMQEVYGVDLRTSLSYILGSEKAADSFLTMRKGHTDKVQHYFDVMNRNLIGDQRRDVTNIDFIKSQARPGGGAPVGRLATAMAKARTFPESNMMEFTGTGYLQPEAGAYGALQSFNEMVNYTVPSLMNPSEVEAEWRSKIGETSESLAARIKGYRSGTPTSSNVKEAIREIKNNQPLRQMIRTMASNTTGVQSAQAMAEVVEQEYGATSLANVLRNDEDLGKLQAALEDTEGEKGMARALSDSLFGGINLGSNIGGYGADADLVTSYNSSLGKQADVISTTLSGVAAVAGVASAFGIPTFGASMVSLGGAIAVDKFGEAYGELDREEAAKIDRRMYGANVLINAYVGLFEDSLGFISWSSSQESAEKVSDYSRMIYGAVKRNPEASPKEIAGKIETENINPEKLLNLIIITKGYLSSVDSPMSIDAFRTAVFKKAEALASQAFDFDEEVLSDYMQEKVLSNRGLAELAARRAGTTRQEQEMAKKTTRQLDEFFKDRDIGSEKQNKIMQSIKNAAKDGLEDSEIKEIAKENDIDASNLLDLLTNISNQKDKLEDTQELADKVSEITTSVLEDEDVKRVLEEILK